MPIHIGINQFLDIDRSENHYKALNGKIVQIQHVESEYLLSLIITPKVNKVVYALLDYHQQRSQLIKLIEHVPTKMEKKHVVNLLFDPKSTLNTYWKIVAPPKYSNLIYLENVITKVRL